MKNYYSTTWNNEVRVHCFDDYVPTVSDFLKLPQKDGKRMYFQQCVLELAVYLPVEGAKVYRNVTHVSRSGMSRNIQFYIIDGTDLVNISRLIAVVTGNKMADNGVQVQGCGMDMAWHLIDCAMRAIYQDNAISANNVDIRAL